MPSDRIPLSLSFLLVYFILARRFDLVFSRVIWGTELFFFFLLWERLRSSEEVSGQAERVYSFEGLKGLSLMHGSNGWDTRDDKKQLLWN